jgi:adenylate kinase family enzyme
MSLTMDEIIERILKRYDPEDLLEALDITSEELLDRFEDKFIIRLQDFEEAVDEDEAEVEQEDEY